jgi:hypothetical protein
LESVIQLGIRGCQSYVQHGDESLLDPWWTF